MPLVDSNEEQVTITVLVEPIAGFAHCPTNPWYPISVVLDAPLGNRQVFDGSVYPAELQTWPPDPDSLDP